MQNIQASVECVWPARAMLGEAPAWHAPSGNVFWCDIKGKFLHAFRVSDGARRTWTPPATIFCLDTPPTSWRAPALAHADANWLVGCTQLGFAWIGVRPEEITIIPISHPERGNSTN